MSSRCLQEQKQLLEWVVWIVRYECIGPVFNWGVGHLDEQHSSTGSVGREYVDLVA